MRWQALPQAPHQCAQGIQELSVALSGGRGSAAGGGPVKARCSQQEITAPEQRVTTQGQDLEAAHSQTTERKQCASWDMYSCYIQERAGGEDFVVSRWASAELVNTEQLQSRNRKATVQSEGFVFSLVSTRRSPLSTGLSWNLLYIDQASVTQQLLETCSVHCCALTARGVLISQAESQQIMRRVSADDLPKPVFLQIWTSL
ncbi:uncharacterized protein LOC115003882 [Cottoperca gobio]|uniref:Uncharacterized protein LOC115003882 n=1 Tax=Cottoperca gobio TaxID=56716 RepID=A0A6J2P8X9_COTGO|nr:uncharacterized protein LOC115003882 [Cottoperca gobio]